MDIQQKQKFRSKLRFRWVFPLEELLANLKAGRDGAHPHASLTWPASTSGERSHLQGQQDPTMSHFGGKQSELGRTGAAFVGTPVELLDAG